MNISATASRREYEQRLHAVLRHIDAHLAEPLELALLAEVANFSAFHFHRLFAAWMGMTLGDYVQRRRIEIAALRLAAQPKLSVLTVALDVGFGSGEAFARAFKKRLGLTPSAWRERALQRRDSNLDQVEGKLDQAPVSLPFHNDGIDIEQGVAAMNVAIREFPAVEVAYLRYEGRYGPPLGEFWRGQVMPWVAQLGLTGREMYGIGHDDPSVADPERCRYDACIALPDGFVGPGGMLRTTLPGGRYACTSFFGRPDTIGATWTALLRDWLPQSGWQLDGRPCFEHYPADARHDPATGAFECAICVPVIPL